ncbi:lactate racemase domain-containing protein [Isosphaeraceae bacterium EP7]
MIDPTDGRYASRIEIPWGDSGRLNLHPPGTWPEPETFSPDLDGGLPDYAAALNAALDTPESGAAPFERSLGPGSKVAIVVDDPSRWTPVRQALPVLLDRIHAAGVRTDDVSISVGVGRHHAVDADSMRKRVGDAIFEAYSCQSPPVDDLSAYDDLGTTPEGIPVRVFRTVARADLRVLVGSVLPHLQAGFGGGYKLVFPGTSHRSTLIALHRGGLDGDTRRLLGGTAADNPMRHSIRAAARLLGPCASVSHLLGPPGTVLRVASGPVDAVQDTLAAEATRRLRAPDRPEADLVIAGNNPWPGDPLMSFKVLLQHRAACRPGGVLLGAFWTDPDELDRSMPLSALRAIAATGAPGGWFIRRGLKAACLATSIMKHPAEFMIRWAAELVVDRHVLVYAPPLHARIGPRLGPVRLFDDQSKLWNAAEKALNGPPRTIRVFPRGGLTYCPSPG